jgi:hypothetical protein
VAVVGYPNSRDTGHFWKLAARPSNSEADRETATAHIARFAGDHASRLQVAELSAEDVVGLVATTSCRASMTTP